MESKAGGTSEVLWEEGVMLLGCGDVGTQEVRAQRGQALCWGRCVAILVYIQHMRRQPPILHKTPPLFHHEVL